MHKPYCVIHRFLLYPLLRYFKGIGVFQDVLPALLLSLKVSFWASGLNLVLGVAVGWLLARCRFPGRNLLDVVLTLPMVMPPTVMGYYLLVLFGRNGVLGQLEQAARVLGLGEWAVFLRVTLPLAWRGILAGLLLAFARALGEFGATLMIAGSIPNQTQTLSIAVYEAVQAGDDALATKLVLLISAVCVAVLWSVNHLAKAKDKA